MTRTTYRLTMAAIAAALCGTLLAATLPTSDPVHSGISQGQALGYIADNTQMAATGAGVATLPAANPQHTGLSQAQLLGYIADYTQDIAANGSGPAKAVRGATTANITISTALNAGDTLDGLTLVAGDRVLVKNQTANSENGIYVVGTSPARAADADAWSELPGLLVIIEAGTANKAKLYAFSGAETGTLGSTAITFAEKAAGAGGGGGTWGSITGDLADQTDLQTILDGSTGGNGAADSGKLLKFDGSGSFAGEVITGDTVIASTIGYSPRWTVTGGISYGSFQQEPGFELTSDRTYYVPDATGRLALQEWVTSQLSDAANITGGTIAPARLGTGTADSGTVLHGDNTWAAVGDAFLGTANAFTALNTSTRITQEAWTDLAGGTALTVSTKYRDSLSANRTLTFSGSAVMGAKIVLALTVTNAPRLTFPSSIRAGSSASPITFLDVPAGYATFTWEYNGSAWILWDTVSPLNNTSASAPTVNDDISLGYGEGSEWRETTSNPDALYRCFDGTDGAAVWVLLSNSTGGGDASTNTSSSVDSELALFSGTGGKTLKRATTTGILKGTSGVLSAATAGTDYGVPSDTAYDATSWNGNSDVPTKNAVRDKIESMGGGSGPATITTQRTTVNVWDEFLWGGNGSTSVPVGPFGFIVGQSGTGVATGNASVSTTDAPGIIQMENGTSAGGYAGVVASSGGIRLGGGTYTIEWRVRVPVLTDGTDNFTVRCGLMDTAAGTDGTDGVFFRYSNANANWVFVTRNNSTETATTSTTSVVADTWYKLRAVVNAGATSVTYTINDADSTAITTNIPTGSTRVLGVGANILRDAGTTERTFQADYCGLDITLSAAR